MEVTPCIRGGGSLAVAVSGAGDVRKQSLRYRPDLCMKSEHTHTQFWIDPSSSEVRLGHGRGKCPDSDLGQEAALTSSVRVCHVGGSMVRNLHSAVMNACMHVHAHIGRQGAPAVYETVDIGSGQRSASSTYTHRRLYSSRLPQCSLVGERPSHLRAAFRRQCGNLRGQMCRPRACIAVQGGCPARATRTAPSPRGGPRACVPDAHSTGPPHTMCRSSARTSRRRPPHAPQAPLPLFPLRVIASPHPIHQPHHVGPLPSCRPP